MFSDLPGGDATAKGDADDDEVAAAENADEEHGEEEAAEADPEVEAKGSGGEDVD